MDREQLDDLQDSLDLLKADKFKQWHWYSNNAINDISWVLDWFEEDPEHIQQEKVTNDCRECIMYTLCVDEWQSVCGADVKF